MSDNRRFQCACLVLCSWKIENVPNSCKHGIFTAIPYISTVDDSYLTLRSDGRAELKVLGSRFLALASPVAGKAEAEAILDTVRKEHFAATHHCFAWRLGRGGEEF